jgi:hypothetical protein
LQLFLETGRRTSKPARPEDCLLKLHIAVAAALLPLLTWGCGVDQGRGRAMQQSVAPQEVVSRELYALGTEVTARGAVPEDAAGETFRRGSEVFLSVDVRSASTDQALEVRWLDEGGRVLHRDLRHAPQGTEYVPFSSGETEDWTSGPHRAVVLIDGRSVSEKPFTMM